MPLCPVLWRSYGEGVGALRRRETAGQEQVSAWGSVAGQFGHLGAERMSSWDPQGGAFEDQPDEHHNSITHKENGLGRTEDHKEGSPRGWRLSRRKTRTAAWWGGAGGGVEGRNSSQKPEEKRSQGRASPMMLRAACWPSDGEEDSGQREEPVQTP